MVVRGHVIGVFGSFSSSAAAGTAAVEAGEAAAAAGQAAAATADTAPDDGDDDQGSDDDADDGWVFAVGFCHAAVPAGECLRRILDLVYRVAHDEVGSPFGLLDG